MKFKRYIPSIFCLAITVVVVLGISIHTANADILGIGSTAVDVVNSALAVIVNNLLAVVALLLSLAAGLLNVSIVFTLHIKEFVNATPAIYTIWQTIRDVTGIFFIFFLLFAAFQIILNLGNSYGKLVINIVVAGILINFSFFIVSVLIDASNVVSLAIFKSMVPTAASITVADANTTLYSIVSSATGLNNTDAGGISDVFMNSLKIQSIYDTNGNKVGTAVADPFKIVLIGAIGVIIMVTAALSFLLAAIAFVARLVILLFLLAFSPIWFAGQIIPQLKTYMGQFQGYLTSQLIFMPVYLLLMYAALSVLNNSKLMGAGVSISGMPTGTNWAFSYMVLGINFAMVIFMLNLPLVVGLKMGGVATEWMNKGISKFSATNLWKNIGGWAGRNTIGRASYNANEYLAKTRIGNTLLGRDIRSGTLGALAKNPMGSGRNYEKLREEHADVVRRAAAIDRLSKLKALIAHNETDPNKYGAVIGPMTPKEKLELAPKYWKDIQFLKQIDDSDYKGYRSSTRVEDTDVIKEEVKGLRREALRDAVAKREDKVIKHLLEEFDGHELMKQIDNKTGKPKVAKPGLGVLEDPDLVEYLTPAHLRAMEDENLEAVTKKNIGKQIENWAASHGGKNHPAFGFVTRKDNESWIK